MKNAAMILVMLASLIAGCGRGAKNRAAHDPDRVENSVPHPPSAYSVTSFDYRSLWLERIATDRESDNEEIVYQGIIGDGYRRIRIKFLTVEPSAQTAGLYNVTGKSNVNGNVCRFEGHLQIERVENYAGDPDDAEAYDGAVHGRYTLLERREDKNSGMFEGEFVTRFRVGEKDGDAFVCMDEGHYTCEGLNDFTGVWTSYQSGRSKICRWGWRIPPDVPGLFRHRENEVYEFNRPYLTQGWESYVYCGGFVVADFDTDEICREDPQILARKRESYRDIENHPWWL